MLARALKAHPDVRLFAAVQMSNHLHLVVEDGGGVLDRFMCLFLGALARAVNTADETSGPVHQRRYSAIEILDDEALLDRIVYTLTNPVAANLVARVEEWPGLVLGPGMVESRKVPDARRAREWVELATSRSVDPEEVRARVRQREEALAAARGGRGVLGRRRVVSMSPFAAPEQPKRSPAPVCHASCGELRRAFLGSWRAFVDAYRRASAAFRGGALDVQFPDWSFRPSLPLLVG